MSDFIIKPLDESTIETQVEIFNQAFNKNATTDTWHYKHFQNPLIKDLDISTILGAYSGETLVGIGAFMPVKFSVADKTFTAVQACDASIRPEWQGKGLYTHINAYAERYYKEHSIDVIFALPYPDFGSYFCFRKLGWEDICTVSTAFIPVNLTNILKSRLPIPMPSLVNIFAKKHLKPASKICKKFPDYICREYENPPEYNAENSSGRIIPCYKEDYFNWKLIDKNIRYITVSKNNKVAGVFIVNCCNDAYIMAEYTNVYNNDESLIIIAHLVTYLAQKYDSIKVWTNDIENTDTSIYRKCGFITKLNKNSYHFMKKVLTADADKHSLLSDRFVWKPQQYDMDNNTKLF